ncbi:metalloregulator ArsR/SmtB family transcription factor [Actinomadura rudentiformis]|uniref:Metalloregulator ArsR/SmtB family transcription factor n=2 Tax=Actinomadura rudentiformis TaxID=359158 RepID=A0A6H9Y717_9ACTN|nr:metalloregulator ArsR/SmtB family transcription factor [Actinomadura rudentiformis]
MAISETSRSDTIGAPALSDERERKTALYGQFARVGKALANPARLELLDLLAQGERSVEELGQAAGMKVGNTSAQLKALAAASLVAARREGAKVFYRLADDGVAELVDQVKHFAAARLAEAERAARDYLGDVQALEPVAQGELARRIDDGDVVVLDVRPQAEYAAGHIPGAINLPHDQLAARLTELTAHVAAGTDIVAYCRGRYCVYAPDAVRLLRDHGYTARPLQGGLPEWRRAGLPVLAGHSTVAGHATEGPS